MQSRDRLNGNIVSDEQRVATVDDLAKLLRGIGASITAELLDAEEAWTYLGLSKSLFYRELAAGNLPASVTVCGQRRWRRKDLEAFVDGLPIDESDS